MATNRLCIGCGTLIPTNSRKGRCVTCLSKLERELWDKKRTLYTYSHRKVRASIDLPTKCSLCNKMITSEKNLQLHHNYGAEGMFTYQAAHADCNARALRRQEEITQHKAAQQWKQEPQKK